MQNASFQRLQLAFLVLLGIAIVLFAIAAQLAGRFELWASAAGVGLAYLGLLSRLFTRDPGSWSRRAAEILWQPVLGTPRRACVACGGALVACVGGAALVLAHTRETVALEVTVTAPPLDAPGASADAQFQVELLLSAEEDALRQSTGRVARFELERGEPGRALQIAVTHPAYQRQSLTTTVGEALQGVMIELVPRPRLVVVLREPGSAPGRGEDFLASARAAGGEASEKRFDQRAEAQFFVGREEDWFVRVHDEGRERVHQSPLIPIDRERKAYVLDLANEQAYPWTPLADFAPQVGRRAAVSESELVAALETTARDADVQRLLVGGPPAGEGVLKREGFLLSYNPSLKIPNWVGYRIDPGETVARERLPLRVDASLDAEHASSQDDYRQSGYDAGHLVSVADMRRLGEAAMRDANLYSALAPQAPALNRGLWIRIEDYARDYVDGNRKWVCVVAGPVFLSRGGQRAQTLVRIGSGVAVPTHFFRVLTRRHEGRLEALCFLVPNESDLSRSIEDYLVPLGELERATGLRFYSDLEPSEQPAREGAPAQLW